MRPFIAFAVIAAFACSDTTAQDKKTQTVELKGIPFTLPADWKEAPSTSNMRLATYQVPPAEGDTKPAEVTFFLFPNQPPVANIERWIGQFESAGREAKNYKGDAKDGEYYVTEISGTFLKSSGGPFAGKKTPVPNQRMLGAILPIKGKGDVFIKIVGPDKTVAAQRKAIRGAVEANVKTEKPYKI